MPHEAFSMLQDRMQIFKRRILRKKPNICPNICPDICQRCKKLEFDPGLVSSTDDFYHPVTRLKESGKDAMFKNDCVMCHALKSICPSEDGSWYACHVPNIMTQFDVQPIGNGKKLVLPQHLISRRWLAVDSHPKFLHHTAYLHSDGFLAELTREDAHIPGPRVNLINHSDVPYGKIRDWIDTCMKQHCGLCTKPPKFMHHLNLIDCHTRLIVDWKPGFRYSALSYVWGTSKNKSVGRYRDKLPRNLPNTIQDAMTVSAQLDIPYLWVDKYCIRDSGEHKAEQIRNMHNIYRGAEITIIAVAGTDPYYGLPGVHPNRPRIPQIQVSFKGHNLISTGRGLKFLLEKSRWAGRGWTLQEGLLSRRRLLFTDEQIFFECDKFHCCESLNLLPLDRHKEILGVPGIRDREPDLSPYRSSERKWDHIYPILCDYTRRQLSHDHNILDAARGVLAYFEDQHPQTFRHLWGLPFFLDADTGSIAKGLTFSLFWNSYSSCKRREGFPSWSWTGWKGSIMFNKRYQDCSKRVEVRIELDDGSFIPSTHDFRHLVQYREISRSISQFLVIKADTVDIEIAPHDQYKGWTAALLHPDAKNCVTQPRHHLKCWYPYFMNEELIHTELRLHKELDSLVWKGLILRKTKDYSSVGGEVSVLVVHKVKDWWERVGVAKFRNTEKNPLRLVDYVGGLEEFRLG